MYVLLLLLSGLTSAVGLALVATGLTAHEAPLDPEFVTSGTIAIVGGLVLVGLGLAVRALQRIEAALAERFMPQAMRADEAPASAVAPAPAVALSPLAAVEQAIAAPRPPAARKPKAEPQPQFAAPSEAPAAEEPALERLREKFPTVVRFDTGLVAEEHYVSPAEAEAGDEVGEVRNVSVAARANGTVPGKVAARLDTAPRRISAPPLRQKASVFEAFWPNGQRPRRGGQPAPASAIGAAPQPPARPPAPAPARVELTHEQEPAAGPQHRADHEPALEARRAADEAALAGPVSVLKSGVVEGMAYTLYSDGSIEAQLPQGRLRFGSITELRNHIESES